MYNKQFYHTINRTIIQEYKQAEQRLRKNGATLCIKNRLNIKIVQKKVLQWVEKLDIKRRNFYNIVL